MATADCTDTVQTTTYETAKIDAATLRLSAAINVIQAIGIYQDNDGDIQRPSDQIIGGALFAARLLMEDAYNAFGEPIKSH